jgi:hypothetical protein
MSKLIMERGEFGNLRVRQDKTGSFIGAGQGRWPANVPDASTALLVLLGKRQAHPMLGDGVVALQRSLTPAELAVLTGQCEHDTGLSAAALVEAWRLHAAVGLEPVEQAGDPLALDALLVSATETRKALAEALIARGDFHAAAVDALGHLDQALDPALKRWLTPKPITQTPTLRMRAIRTGPGQHPAAAAPRTRSGTHPASGHPAPATLKGVHAGGRGRTLAAAAAIAASLLIAVLASPGDAAPAQVNPGRTLAPGVVLVEDPAARGTVVQLDLSVATEASAAAAVKVVDPAAVLAPIGEGLYLLERTAANPDHTPEEK